MDVYASRAKTARPQRSGLRSLGCPTTDDQLKEAMMQRTMAISAGLAAELLRLQP
jgi:hypothetical protein